MMYAVAQWAILLSHMLKTPSVLKFAATKLQPEFFVDPRVGATRWQSMLFSAISQFYARYGQPPDAATIRNEIRIHVERTFPPGSAEGLSILHEVDFFLNSFVHTVTEVSSGQSTEAAQWMYRTCVVDIQAQQLLQQASQDGNYEDVAASLLKLTAGSTGTADLTVRNVVDLRLTDVGDRVFTGLPFFDSRFGEGRGLTAGCCLGIIAPQAAGKSTLGIQMTVAQAALLNRPSMLVLVEEGLNKSVWRNILACTTGIPTPVWEVNHDDVAETLKAAGRFDDVTRTKLENLNRNLTIVDLVEHEGSLEAVEQQIDMAADAGHRPHLIYIDWAGVLANKIMALGHGGQKFDKLEAAIKHVSSTLVQKAVKYNCLVTISQQMDTINATRGTTAKHDAYCARDCKSFLEQFKYGITINTREQGSDLTLMQCVKSRNDARPEPWIVKMFGAMARFEETKTHRISGKRFTKLHADEHQIPKE